MRTRSGLGAALLSAALVACSSDQTHAPHLASGSSMTTPIGHIGGNEPGTGGGGSTLDAGALGTGTLTGTVSVFDDDLFVAATPFTGAGTIVVRGIHDVTEPFSGSNFSVDQVDEQASLWVGIQATSGGTDLVPTIMPVDGRATSVALAFGRASALAQILAAAVNTPVSMQSDHAQIVVGFVSTSTAAPISGVQITQSTGQAVLYDSGTTYSDVFGSTQSRGMAVIANATASGQFPGQRTTITYKVATTNALGTFDVLAAPGAMTIALVPVKQ